MQAIKADIASLFTDRAISYRVDKGFDHYDVALSIGVQKMIRSDKASSGVMFTIDTETGFRDVVVISSSYGLGEMIVQGKVTPDEFTVFKPTLKDGLRPIIKKNLGEKKTMMIYSTGAGSNGRLNNPVKEISVPEKMRKNFTLTDDEILKLASWGMEIEKHYSEKAGKPMPMDTEWAKDGVTGELYIVQARPETVQVDKNVYEMTEYKLRSDAKSLVEGVCVGSKIVSGKVRIITEQKSCTNLNRVRF